MWNEENPEERRKVWRLKREKKRVSVDVIYVVMLVVYNTHSYILHAAFYCFLYKGKKKKKSSDELWLDTALKLRPLEDENMSMQKKGMKLN